MELQKDAERLRTDDVFRISAAALHITDRGDQDKPCGQGGLKRILSATAEYTGKSIDAKDHLYQAQRVMENTLTLFGYRIEHDPSQTGRADQRLIRAIKEEYSIKLTATVSPRSPNYKLQAETECLPR